MPIRCRSDLWRAASFAALVALGVAGCKSDTPAPELAPVGAALMEQEKDACLAQDGQWMSEGVARFCLMRTRDADQACRTKADCEGACLARSMSCAPVTPLVGCNEVVTSAGLRVTECVN